MRRTRSLQDITPDRLPAAGSPSRIHHDNSRLTQSLNPQKPFFPHRRTVYVHASSGSVLYLRDHNYPLDCISTAIAFEAIYTIADFAVV